jgi:MFS family permease
VWLGIIAAIAPLSVIFIVHVMGSLSDHVGRRRVILFGLVLCGFSIVLFLLARGPLLLLLARALEAVGFMTVLLTALARINDHVQTVHRGAKQGLFLSLQHVGNMLGPLVGAWLATRFSPDAPFLVALVLFATLGLLLKDAPRKGDPGAESLQLIEHWRQFLRVRKLRAIAVLGIVGSMLAPAMYFFLPLLILERFGRIEYIGYALFTFGALKPLQFITGRFVDRLGRLPMLLIGFLIIGLGYFLIPVTYSLSMLLLSMLIISIGFACYNVASWTVLSDIGEANHLEGQIVGSFASLAKIGDLAGSLLFGVIAAFFGYAVIFSISGYLVVAGAVFAGILLVSSQRLLKE